METPEQKLMTEVQTELARARSLFKPIYSPHEALGIIREEYLEWEAEVYKFNLAKGRDTRPKMRTELVQLATMALRTVLDALEFDPRAEPNLCTGIYNGAYCSNNLPHLDLKGPYAE
jgi:hypothetical protein